MEKEFVPYSLALDLKELGFNEPCLGVYYGKEITEDDVQFVLDYRDSQYYASKGYANGYLAPLYQQAFNWFRDKHDLRAWVQWGSEYLCLGQIQYSSGHIECISHGSTNEEAELACLKKLIEIVTKK